MEEIRERRRRGERLKFGVVLFDDHALLDVYGPLEFLAATNFVKAGTLDILTIAIGTANKRVTPYQGPVTITEYCGCGEVPQLLDVLLIPGGPGVETLLNKKETINDIEELSSAAKVVCSISEGSLLLAQSGLLNGRSATTKKTVLRQGDVQAQFGNVRWQTRPRWVCDEPFYTAAGVSAGMDMVYSILGELFGPRHQRLLGELAEYQAAGDATDDPFEVATVGTVAKSERELTIGLVLYESFEMMDTFGPLEMFAVANRLMGGKAFSLTALAEFKIVKSVGGPQFEVSTLFDELAEGMGFDILLIPGGIGTLREVHNVDSIQKFLKDVVPRTGLVMTVCSGSTILASAGLLDGRRATSNKLAFDLLAQYGPSVNWVENARWVVDGKFHLSSGVSAGTDLSLFVIQQLFDVDTARVVARTAEYSWNEDSEDDPFSSTIPAQTVMRKLITRSQRALLWLMYMIGMRIFGFPMHSVAKLLN